MTPRFRTAKQSNRTPGKALLAAGLLLAVTACGGGGGGTSSSTVAGDSVSWVAGVFRPSADFAARCIDPRTGTDPATGRAYPDRAGTRVDENNWLRSWSNELYLWYREIVDRDPALYETPAYFDLLKTEALTASGRPKDNFHFTLSTEEWQALSESGVAAGYGVVWALQAARPPRDIRVGFTEPGTPAASSTIGLVRGTRVIAIDGVDAINGNTSQAVDTLNAALFPDSVGESHQFTVADPVSGAQRDVTLTSALIASAPVPAVSAIDTGSGVVGYVLFNDHIATAEAALIDAVNELNAAAIDDLVIDLRYNSGGFLEIASEFAYMIAGRTRTEGRTFEFLQFNDKHPVRNPVTGELLRPIPFLDAAAGFSAVNGQPLPTLQLERVFLLTGPETCSASESIMNALRGIDFPVIQIGSTTCGKPYGFYPTDNCGTTYFSVQFSGENDKGFGEYPDGFSPENTPDAPGVAVAGCAVGDDFSRALGDPAEARFAAALGWRETATCPTPSGVAEAVADLRTRAAPTRIERPLVRPAWRQARIIGG